MKKRLNIFIGAVVMLLAWSSCISENFYEQEVPETQSLHLLIREAYTSTRVAGDSIRHNTYVTFTTGDLYLLCVAGNVVEHFIISNTQLTNRAANIISRNDLVVPTGATTGGVLIDEVDGDVVEVLIIGNTAGNATSGAITPIINRQLAITTQQNVQNLNLFGRAPLVYQPTRNLYRASVYLAPTVARLEIPDVVGAGNITGFRVTGVMLHRFYQTATIRGAVVPTSRPVNPVTHAVSWQSSNTAINNEWLQGTYPVASPAGQVWGHQLFALPRPRTNSGVAGTPPPLPRIIIRLEDITVRAGTPAITGRRYLNIDGFHTAHTGLNAGTVYRIRNGSIIFCEQIIDSAVAPLSLYPHLVIEVEI